MACRTRSCVERSAAVPSLRIMRPSQLLQGSVAVACGLAGMRAAGAEDDAAVATQRTIPMTAGLGYAWGNSDDLNRFGWNVVAQIGYTAANSLYMGVMVGVYRPDSVEYELESEESYTITTGVELGYDRPLSENWAMRLGLVNGVAGFATTHCTIKRDEFGSAFDETTCAPLDYDWMCLIGPSVTALYIGDRGLLYTSVVQSSFVNGESAFFGVGVVVGFGALHRIDAKRN